MKFNKGDHLQEIDSQNHGIVISILQNNGFNKHPISGPGNKVVYWYLLENNELNLVNHWVPQGKLELHKQPLRDIKLKELGI